MAAIPFGSDMSNLSLITANFFIGFKLSHYICVVILFSTFLFIGGSEVLFILFIVVMLFGADKLPEIARGLGKGMRTLRDATDDLKSEISKSAEQNGINTSEYTKAFTEEIQKIKDEVEDTMGSIKREL